MLTSESRRGVPGIEFVAEFERESGGLNKIRRPNLSTLAEGEELRGAAGDSVRLRSSDFFRWLRS
jgi:hypothetical protein